METFLFFAGGAVFFYGFGKRVHRLIKYKKNLEPGEELEVFFRMNKDERFFIEAGLMTLAFAILFWATW
jgi:hypothetical protein